MRRGGAGLAGAAFGFTDFLGCDLGISLGVNLGKGIDLSLAQAGEIGGDGFVVVESEMLGVGADEAFVEDAAGEAIEVFFFDGLEHARADLGDVGNVIEGESFFLALFAEFIAEFAHFARRVLGTS